MKWSQHRTVVSDSLWPHGLVHGIFQDRILEWVAVPFSRGSSQPRNQTQVFRIAGGFFTSWATKPGFDGLEIDGETVETVSDFIFWGSKITVDGDCSHEIKRRLLLGRKVVTNLDSILISRDITLPTKVHIVQAMAFPVVVYGCESWTIKKVECRKIDAF